MEAIKPTPGPWGCDDADTDCFGVFDVSQNVSGPCGGCGRTPAKMHIASLAENPTGLFCADCCPVHGQEVLWDKTDPVTIAGSQEDLF